jgi:hypothetical protein
MNNIILYRELIIGKHGTKPAIVIFPEKSRELLTTWIEMGDEKRNSPKQRQSKHSSIHIVKHCRCIHSPVVTSNSKLHKSRRRDVSINFDIL